MAKSIKVTPKKPRGRPATGREPVRTFRASDEFIASVDKWASKQVDTPARGEAIRRLVELGLSASKPRSVSTSSQRKRAAELAGDQIDGMVGTGPDGTAMKRRLTEGPSIFRSSRKDR